MQRDDLDTACRMLAAEVLEAARTTGVTIGCAESCTGGLIASYLTAVPGSSESFVGGVVSYWADVKESLLHVDPIIIREHGVVSESCALAMAKGACEALSCDLAVATTGIAGPSGAEPGKPVGTVCFGLYSATTRLSWTTCEGNSRDEVRLMAVKKAFEMLLRVLNGNS